VFVMALHELCSRRVSPSSTCVLAAHFAPPCRSFSPLNKWRVLRTRDDPEGRLAPVDYAEYIARENAIIRAAVAIAEIFLSGGRPATFENLQMWPWKASPGCGVRCVIRRASG
ncbi:MAG: hypothetical protein SGPRY_013669, partial [Prymnesium sp.]